jgi:hypothetical protein
MAIKYINLALFVGMIVMNYLANALPLNNMTTGQLADKYPNLFVPAGITFSIWGVIYLLLAVFCVLQFTWADKASIEILQVPFALTCILNSLWIVFWHYQKVSISVFVIIAFLITLIYMNKQISSLPVGILKSIFGVYLGWLCIATIANITALLVYFNWHGGPLSEETWSIIMILAGAVIASLAIYSFRNPFIGLSVIWAFTGIIIKRHSDFRSIVIASVVAIFIVGVIMIIHFFIKGGFTQNQLS